MRFFSRLKWWQKGTLSAFLFTIFIGLIYTIVLIVMDAIFSSKGLPVHCYALTKTIECNLTDAIFSKLGFFIIFELIFGIPISIIGGLIGYMIDKISIK
jgi:hypothetical protein